MTRIQGVELREADDRRICIQHRSVNMDAWSNEQLKIMEVGGNKKMNDFFAKYGIAKETEITTKYSSKAAEVRVTLN